MAFVIVGLGNPEGEYTKTRHNAGYLAVERIREREGFPEFKERKASHARVSEGIIAGEKVVLALPTVSMNLSGKAVAALVKSKPAAKKLLIIRDELDLPLGSMKMTFGRGSGGHKGIESAMRATKTKDFAQLKLGISGMTPGGKLKKPGDEGKVVKHVLGKWKPEEEKKLAQVLDKAAEAARRFVAEGTEAATMFANTD